MATMAISLPDSLKDRVEAQARTGRYGNAGDSMHDLIRRDEFGSLMPQSGITSRLSALCTAIWTDTPFD